MPAAPAMSTPAAALAPAAASSGLSYSCGSSARYAHLYSSHNHLSASFYLPSWPPAAPAGSPCVGHVTASGHGHGSGAAQAFKRWSVESMESPDDADEQQEDPMSVMIDGADNHNNDKPTEVEEDMHINLLPYLRRHFYAASASSSEATSAVEDKLVERLFAKFADAGKLYDALRAVEQDPGAGCGLEMIKVVWRVAAGTHGIENDRVLTLETMHEAGLTFTVRLALDSVASARLQQERALTDYIHAGAGAGAGAATAPNLVKAADIIATTNTASAQQGDADETMAHVVPEALRAAVPKVVASSFSFSDADTSYGWLATQRKAEWVRVSDALRLASSSSSTRTSSVASHVAREAAGLYDMLLCLSVPAHLREALDGLAAKISSSSASRDEDVGDDDEEEEEAHRGRHLTPPDMQTQDTVSAAGAGKDHRSDSAVAGLGFSPRDERPSAMDTMGAGTAPHGGGRRSRLQLLEGKDSRKAAATDSRKWFADASGELHMLGLPAVYCA